MTAAARILYSCAEAVLLMVAFALVRDGHNVTAMFVGALAVVIGYIEGAESRRNA